MRRTHGKSMRIIRNSSLRHHGHHNAGCDRTNAKGDSLSLAREEGTPILEALGDAPLLALQGDGLDAGDAAEGW